MKVINKTRLTQFVDVRHKSGEKDTVRIAPRGRVDLREGMGVDVRWQQLNPNVIEIVPDVKPPITFAIPKAAEPVAIANPIAQTEE